MDPFALALLGSTAASTVGGLMGNRASRQAAGTQSAAAQQSGILGLIAQQQAIQAQKEAQAKAVGALQQGVEAYNPYQQFGTQATNRYATLMGIGGDSSAPGYGSLMTQPTRAEIELDPGYAFREQQGMQAVNRSAAAQAGLQSGAALKAAQRFGQELGSQEYGNAYERFMRNRNNQIAMLQGGVNTGLTAAGGIGGLQRDAANVYSGTGTNVANTLLANPYGQGIENAAQARASGYIGGTSALQGALNTPVNAMMAYGMADRFAPQNRTSTYANQTGYLYGAPNAAGFGAGYNPGFMGAPMIR